MNRAIKKVINIILVVLILFSTFSNVIIVKADSGFNKYTFSEKELKGIAKVCEREQGSAVGAAAEASLMANRFELYKNSSGTGSQLYNYIKRSRLLW